MQSEYGRISALEKSQQAEENRHFLEQLRHWIINTEPDRSFRQQLSRRLMETFGEQGNYAVFVRSDTNVEDLPGFTGAGLNLTVPNVIGFENVLEAIQRVWASPFSERAFAWRQNRMNHPEHVYPSVLLMKSVAVCSTCCSHYAKGTAPEQRILLHGGYESLPRMWPLRNGLSISCNILKQ